MMELKAKTRAHKILIVEDIDDILEVVAEMVDWLGYRRVTARDGVEAVATARRELPDLVLMDVWLPKQNGAAAAREIRALPACAQTPIIRFSAFDEPTDEDGQREHFDWDAYLPKPVQFELLEETLRNLLEKAEAG